MPSGGECTLRFIIECIDLKGVDIFAPVELFKKRSLLLQTASMAGYEIGRCSYAVFKNYLNDRYEAHEALNPKSESSLEKVEKELRRKYKNKISFKSISTMDHVGTSNAIPFKDYVIIFKMIEALPEEERKTFWTVSYLTTRMRFIKLFHEVLDDKCHFKKERIANLTFEVKATPSNKRIFHFSVEVKRPGEKLIKFGQDLKAFEHLEDRDKQTEVLANQFARDNCHDYIPDLGLGDLLALIVSEAWEVSTLCVFDGLDFMNVRKCHQCKMYFYAVHYDKGNKCKKCQQVESIRKYRKQISSRYHLKADEKVGRNLMGSINQILDTYKQDKWVTDDDVFLIKRNLATGKYAQFFSNDLN